MHRIILSYLEYMFLLLYLSYAELFSYNEFVLKEVGEREGKFYAINVPLKDGIDDSSFNRLFKTVSRCVKFQHWSFPSTLLTVWFGGTLRKSLFS